ncbi:TolC family protein, partial [Myxococcota bacterium]|nr:TolC family protein [Myxococcota bacterium]
VLSKSEVLKLNSALGNAIQSRLQAESGVTLSLDVLKMHMGETGNANYRLTNTFPAPKQLLTLTARQAFALMEESRPELLQLKRRREMIQLSHKASRIMLLPSASVIAQYQHNEGMGTMQPKNSWFVGINISWTWEWNKKHLESDLILSQVQQLDATVKQIRLGLRLNVKSHLLAVKTAWNKIAIARIAIKEAAEGLRLEELRFGAKLKTSVSLLDAQTRYDGAQISLTNSIYEYYKSVASLMQAMGVKTLKRSAIPW